MNLFNFIKSHVQILDVVQLYTTLKRAGHYWKGSCPFHSEKTASFTVSPHKEIFYCFGCHAGGDVITFISKIESCGQKDAAITLAEKFGLDIPAEIMGQSKEATEHEQQERKRYWQLCRLVTSWCHKNYSTHPEIQEYIAGRNITPESVNNFQIGFFPRGPKALQSLLQFIQKEQFLADDLINAKIVSQSKGMLYSPFEDRIMFPITDHLGRHCGFGGRIYKKLDERAKYYNSHENEFFTKGSLVFGLDLAKQTIQKTETVFLVEGYTDCIAMAQYGYHNTVATLGTACTPEHLKQLARYARVLTVMYDGDNAGHNAILRLTELCWQVNLELNVISLPDKEDPASYLEKHGSLDPLLEGRQDIFMFFIQSVGKDYASNTLHAKLAAVRKLVKTISNLSDDLKKDILLQQMSSTFDIPYDTLKKELYREYSSPGYHQEEEEESYAAPDEGTSFQDEIPELEKKLFSVILNRRDRLPEEDLNYLIQYIDPRISNLLKKLELLRQGDTPVEFIQFFNVLSEPEKLLVSKMVLEYQELDQQDLYDQLLLQLQKKHWKTFVLITKTKLAAMQDASGSPEATKILYEFQELKKKLLKRGLI